MGGPFSFTKHPPRGGGNATRLRGNRLPLMRMPVETDPHDGVPEEIPVLGELNTQGKTSAQIAKERLLEDKARNAKKEEA